MKNQEKEELKAIFNELRNGNKEVIENLYKKYDKLIYGVAFSILKNKDDSEAIEVFLADDKKREEFYNLLCVLGRALNLVLNAEQVYNSLNRDELEKYKNTFTFFICNKSKI